jgi:anthranilate synthase component 2
MTILPQAGREPVLFVENDDSFTWNVVECLPFERHEVHMLPGAVVAADLGVLARFRVVVVGPGPTDPVRAGLAGIVAAAAARRQPLLGVCLGHQALGLAFGATLERALPMHGKQSRVVFSTSRLFAGSEGAHEVMRYNSLLLTRVPPPLVVVARAEDGGVMAIEHESLPLAGLQFHPDSYASPTGRAIVAAFFRAVS